ncbi:multidrug resistance protein mdtL [Enterobacter hormaechei]|nr:multidrug resistance protein mdtL [Enterobacter hormaechei]SAD09812.1 multidrug resistance protein mdtL [Enterobacter hormaechei]SAE69123.1 multidrug resistance protein mdtL [Enterobacter hormaechei]
MPPILLACIYGGFMARFLFCSFALVLLYPSGIDMYLVGLPHIARDLGASEAQLHIAFSAYLAGMASSMVFAGKIADRAGRQPVAITGAVIFTLASVLCSMAQESTMFLSGRFILSRLAIITLSVAVILTYVNVSPVLLMETIGFDRGEYSTVMALNAMVSMAVSFSMPFALNIFRQRTLMLASQTLFLAAGVILATATSHALMLVGMTLICAGFSGGFGVAMSQALGPFSLRAGVASSVLGIAQVCGSSLWIWLAAVIGLNALNMLIGVLIGCSILCITLLMVIQPAAHYEEAHQQSRS